MKVKVTWHVAKYGYTYSEFVLCIYPIQSAHNTVVNTTHTPWTHTRSSGQPFMLRRPGSSWGFGALLKGTSVVVLKVERALYIHSPTYNSCRTGDSNSQSLGYESDSLTIRPRLPHKWTEYYSEYYYQSIIRLYLICLKKILFEEYLDISHQKIQTKVYENNFLQWCYSIYTF